MAIRTADKIRLLVTIVAMIGLAAAVGLMPSLWATF